MYDSVQYLQQPERVFAEIYRVLRPGGVCIITFSNRMFYSKARQGRIHVFMQLHPPSVCSLSAWGGITTIMFVPCYKRVDIAPD